jgi:hypothetical protein
MGREDIMEPGWTLYITHDTVSYRDASSSANKGLHETHREIWLWLQRFAPALPVVALAGQLGEIFCIGTGGATVFFAVIRHTVASGMGTFRFRNHGRSISRRFQSGRGGFCAGSQLVGLNDLSDPFGRSLRALAI